MHINAISFSVSWFLLLCVLSNGKYAEAKNKCQPVTWGKRDIHARSTKTNRRPPLPDQAAKFGPGGPKAGDLVCRFYIPTIEHVDYYWCSKLAQTAGIDNEDFFLWNPELKKDCSNIKPLNWYCVNGYFEPLRAHDGKCGPPNNNATCAGTDKPCCNAKTFTCGDTRDDCIDGNCYEGECPGHDVFATDGKCGPQHGNRQCGGIWGQCCNKDGECGDGDDFCGAGACMWGNCTVKPTGPPAPAGVTSLPYVLGNSTDGQCGGPDRLMCGVVVGYCCNSEGRCGGLPTDCGPGCQPQFGKCDSSEPPIPTTTTPPTEPTVAFQFQPNNQADCAGDTSLDLVKVESGSNGKCVNLDCGVASLNIHDTGDCPAGQVRISYWQESDCAGAWYGYGYSSRDTCRTLWGGGMNSKSIWVKCAPQSDDCVSQGDCTPDAEPSTGICYAESQAFSLKSHNGGDCSEEVHNDVSVPDGSNGLCINTDCVVGSLDIASAGKCPDGEVQLSYWGDADCSGDWYGYGYGSRNTCRQLWSGGQKFKSLWLKCAKKEDNCVSQGSCEMHPEPENAKC